jgi:hypothetical protein
MVSTRSSSKGTSSTSSQGVKHEREHSVEEQPAKKIKTEFKINRAPVLVLWVTVVAEKQGFKHDEALTMGKSIAGLFAHTKAKSIGIAESSDTTNAKSDADKVSVFGIEINTKKTEDGIRAVNKSKAISPESVTKYLSNAFGDHLEEYTTAMKELADSYSKDEIGEVCYELYEKFRPEVPAGIKGWGRKSALPTEQITKLKK